MLNASIAGVRWPFWIGAKESESGKWYWADSNDEDVDCLVNLKFDDLLSAWISNYTNDG